MDLEKNWPAPLQCKNHRDRNGQPVSSFFFHLPKYCPAQQPKSQTLLRFKKQRTRKKTKNMVTKVFTQYFCRTKGCEKKWLRFPVFRAETWNVHRLARFLSYTSSIQPPSFQAATSAALVSRWSAFLSHAAVISRISFAASLLLEHLVPTLKETFHR